MRVATIILYVAYGLLGIYGFMSTGQTAVAVVPVLFAVGLVGIWRKDKWLSRAAILFPVLYALVALTDFMSIVRFQTSNDILGATVFFSIPAIVNEVRLLREPKITADDLASTPAATFATASRNPASTEVRLRKIESLKAKGAITEAEYQTRREQILDEV